MLEAYEGGVQDVYCFLPLHRFFQERVFRVCEQILIKYYQVGRHSKICTNTLKRLGDSISRNIVVGKAEKKWFKTII